jgi:spermidine synthase
MSLLQRALDPFFVLAWLLALLVAMSVSPAIGLLRSASVAGLLLALWAHWHVTLHGFLERTRLPRARLLSTSAALLFGLHALGFTASERWVSLDDLGYFHDTIVYKKKSERSELVVTSGGGGLHLFVDRALKLTEHDAGRYYESLVQPALAAATRPRWTAVLGAADGMVARRLLEHPDVKNVDVVTMDASLSAAAREMPWLSALNGRSLESPKVRLVEQEALVWLGRTRTKYDIIIVDLMDPTDYQHGKNYTTQFYRRIAARLRPGGVVAVQATSPFDSPRTFANVNATMKAAGFGTLCYRAAIPSLGDWGFVLASREHLDPPREPVTRVESVNAGTLRAMFHLPEDMHVSAERASTLYDQRAVHLLTEERRNGR